jgi:hypothetical protein
VPETVKRIHQLYENIHLTSVIDSPKVLRFWMQLWYCNAQDACRGRLEAVRDAHDKKSYDDLVLDSYKGDSEDDAERRLLLAKKGVQDIQGGS